MALYWTESNVHCLCTLLSRFEEVPFEELVLKVALKKVNYCVCFDRQLEGMRFIFEFITRELFYCLMSGWLKMIWFRYYLEGLLAKSELLIYWYCRSVCFMPFDVSDLIILWFNQCTATIVYTRCQQDIVICNECMRAYLNQLGILRVQEKIYLITSPKYCKAYTNGNSDN